MIGVGGGYLLKRERADRGAEEGGNKSSDKRGRFIFSENFGRWGCAVGR